MKQFKTYAERDGAGGAGDGGGGADPRRHRQRDPHRRRARPVGRVRRRLDPGGERREPLFRQVNANGGVHGRQIRYIVEDHGYQLPRATQAYNKLIERDQVFAMLLNLGTPHNLAHYPLMERREVPNINPLTAARAILPDPPGHELLGLLQLLRPDAGGDRIPARGNRRDQCLLDVPAHRFRRGDRRGDARRGRASWA
jgi:hypothetical protein